MENFILPRMPLCDMPYFHNPRVRKILRTLKKKRICSSWKKARLVIDDENNCRFDVQREEHWIHTRPTRSKTVWERLLELFGD